jgi:hypothetical protein
MGNGVFNVAKGRAVELHNRVQGNDPATAGLMFRLLKATESDAVLKDYDTFADLLGAAGNVEADFTNYSGGKTIIDTDISIATLDDATDTYRCDIDDQTFTSAGGTTDNTLVKVIICYAPDVAGADSTFIPLTYHDFFATTDGTDLIAAVHVDGYFSAT